MSDQAQSPAELIRAMTLGYASAQEVCANIEGWQTDLRVGGFINLCDCPQQLQDRIYRTYFNVSWPEGLEMPVDESADGHADLVKAFNKKAKKAAKASKKAGATNIAQPFSKISYGAGSEFVKLGYCQLHASIEIQGVKVAVHFWGAPSPTTGWEEGHHPYPFLPKLKLDKEEQLKLFI